MYVGSTCTCTCILYYVVGRYINIRVIVFKKLGKQFLKNINNTRLDLGLLYNMSKHGYSYNVYNYIGLRN